MFSSLLIANRGEIACRIAATARRLGIRTIAAYSDADAGARHVALCDEAWRLGPAPAAQSYLNVERLLEIARRSGAQAVHPGYGFLAESAPFARAVAERGLIFVGPPAAAIETMGDKRLARRRMEEAGVPVVDGWHGDDQTPAALARVAARIGYPVLIKAGLGGGGKGMRVVPDAAQFDAMLAACRREAENAFGDDRVLLERWLPRPRHIEIQILADAHGRCVHLFERDCSVQRRYQKVIEEAPAPGIGPKPREALGRTAIAAARAVGYVGAGTVEFLVDADGAFHFMEMNTRLQVEHPVTEMITGLDLVEWQLRIAGGEPLPLRQDDLRPSGHAIEARIYAENPAKDFLPSTGTVRWLRTPEAVEFRIGEPRRGSPDIDEPDRDDHGVGNLCRSGSGGDSSDGGDSYGGDSYGGDSYGDDSYDDDPGRDSDSCGGSAHRTSAMSVAAVRIDSGVRQGDVIGPHYDPLIAKLIAHGADRTQALARLQRALARFHIIGPASNVDFLRRLIATGSFADGRLDTGLIERERDALFAAPVAPSLQKRALAAAVVLAREHDLTAGSASPWSRRNGWRIGARLVRTLDLVHAGGRCPVQVEYGDGAWWIREARPETPASPAAPESDPAQPHARWDGQPDARSDARASGPASVPAAAGAPDGLRLTLLRWSCAARGSRPHAIDTCALTVQCALDDRTFTIDAVVDGTAIHVFGATGHDVFEQPDPLASGSVGDTGEPTVAPMPGRVIAVFVTAGAIVERGQPLLAIEAMKMEHTIVAPSAGRIEAVHFGVGDQVVEGERLVELKTFEEESVR